MPQFLDKYNQLSSSLTSNLSALDSKIDSLPLGSERTKYESARNEVNSIISGVDNLKSQTETQIQKVVSTATAFQEFGKSCIGQGVLDIPISEFFDGMGLLQGGSIFDSVSNLEFPDVGSLGVDEYVSRISGLLNNVDGKVSQLISYISEMTKFSDLNQLVQTAIGEVSSLISCTDDILRGLNGLSDSVGMYNPELENVMASVNYAKTLSDRPSDIFREARTRLVSEAGWEYEYEDIKNALTTKKSLFNI